MVQVTFMSIYKTTNWPALTTWRKQIYYRWEYSLTAGSNISPQSESTALTCRYFAIQITSSLIIFLSQVSPLQSGSSTLLAQDLCLTSDPAVASILVSDITDFQIDFINIVWQMLLISCVIFCNFTTLYYFLSSHVLWIFVDGF